MSGGSSDNKVEDTPQMKYLAQTAAEGWNFSQENLAPLQRAYEDKVESMDDQGRKDYVAGKANLGQQSAMTDAVSSVTAGASSRGIDLNSGRVKGGLTDIAIGSAESGGNVAAQGLFEQDSQYIGGLQSLVDIGNGEQTQAVAGLSDVAGLAQSNARGDAVNSFNRRSANLQTLGTLAGAGLSYGLNQNSAMGGTTQAANSKYSTGLNTLSDGSGFGGYA